MTFLGVDGKPVRLASGFAWIDEHGKVLHDSRGGWDANGPIPGKEPFPEYSQTSRKVSDGSGGTKIELKYVHPDGRVEWR